MKVDETRVREINNQVHKFEEDWADKDDQYYPGELFKLKIDDSDDDSSISFSENSQIEDQPPVMPREILRVPRYPVRPFCGPRIYRILDIIGGNL